MKDIWVLSERTDFKRGGEYDYQNYQNNCYVFTTFEEAKAAMRKRIVELANEKGSVYDGPEILLKSPSVDPSEYDREDMPNEPLPIFQYLLNNIGHNENFTLSKDDINKVAESFGVSSLDADFGVEGWTDYLMGFGFICNDIPELICHGYDDGPYNDVNPYIYINCFNMDDPNQKYCFHFEDHLYEEHFTSHMFLELVKKSIDDKTPNLKEILSHVDYAPEGVDLSKLGTEREVSVEELLSDEALHKDFLADKKVQEYIINLVKTLNNKK